jgi:3-oxoadipate enol-lactonase
MALLEVHGVRHAFRLEGHAGGPVLVLTHALGTDHSLWDGVVPELPQFQVLRYDLRGHGASELPQGDCTLRQLADDLLALTAALGLRRFAVAGVSLGAMVAMQAAALAPERVQRLILCSTAARLPGPPGGWDGRARQAIAQGMDALAPAMMQRMFAPQWLARGEPIAGTLEQVFRHTDPAGYAAACGVLREADLAAVLPQVQAPALVVRGMQDLLITREAASQLAAALPHARGTELDCGHYPMVELPERLAELSAGFLLAEAPASVLQGAMAAVACG